MNKALITPNQAQNASYAFDGRRIRSLFHNLDVRQSTRRDYQKRATRFLNFIHKNGLNFNTLLEYKRTLEKDNTLGVTSKNKYLSVARITLAQLYRMQYVSVDLSTGVKVFPQNKKHKRMGVTPDEMEQIGTLLSNYIREGHKCRTVALVALLANQGLRQEEVTRLTVKDLNLDSKVMKVIGKGRSDYELVRLHPNTLDALQYYLWQKMDYVSCDPPIDSPVFPSCNDRTKPITTRQIRNIVQNDVYKPLGIVNTTHGLRHYFTTQMIKHSDGNLLEVAKFTRHRSIEMLQTYYDETETDKFMPNFIEALPTFEVFA